MDFHSAQTNVCSGGWARCLQREAEGHWVHMETPLGSGNGLIGSLLQACFEVPQGGDSRVGPGQFRENQGCIPAPSRGLSFPEPWLSPHSLCQVHGEQRALFHKLFHLQAEAGNEFVCRSRKQGKLPNQTTLRTDLRLILLACSRATDPNQVKSMENSHCHQSALHRAQG